MTAPRRRYAYGLVAYVRAEDRWAFEGPPGEERAGEPGAPAIPLLNALGARGWAVRDLMEGDDGATAFFLEREEEEEEP